MIFFNGKYENCKSKVQDDNSENRNDELEQTALFIFNSTIHKSLKQQIKWSYEARQEDLGLEKHRHGVNWK